MADLQMTHGGDSSVEDTGQFQTAAQGGSGLKTMTHVAGAGLSLALLVGIGVWGYKLVQRDVSGIPVVRALEGEMRVRPEDPGGQLARNTGLSVNAVAASGTAAAPADTLVLAPQPVGLDPADTDPVAPLQQQPVTIALDGGSIDDVVAALTEGVAPMDAASEAAPITAPEPLLAETPPAPEPKVEKAVLSGPGMNLSLRPVLRPASGPAKVEPARAEAAPQAEVSPETIPVGTRLAQLGAYDSADLARAEWERVKGSFGSYLSGKSRVIQRAKSGGRTFYRLRVHGFEGLADARRFCAALGAEGQDCIPVEVR